MLNNFTVFSIEDTEVKGCKVSVDYFKTLINKKYGSYCISNLKQVYKKLTGIVLKTNINFYITNGTVVLIPESGKGFNFDWSLINNVLKMNDSPK